MAEVIFTNEELKLDTDQNAREYWKEKAGLLGITFAQNISTEKLKNLVQEKMAENEAKTQGDSNQGTRGVTAISKLAPEVIKAQEKATALVRYRITVLNPNLQKATGMIVTVGNANIAPIKRVIPFNAPVWHAERIIIDTMKEMKYQSYNSKWNEKLRGNFDDHENIKLKPTFSIEELPPLTPEELQALKEMQAAQGTGQTDAEQIESNSL